MLTRVEIDGFKSFENFSIDLRAELIWQTSYQSRRDATSAIGRNIDGYYNVRRRTSGAHAPH